MKATFDLPEQLLRQLKMRAARDGRTVKELASEFIRDGLENSPAPKRPAPPVILKDKKTGLLVIQCGRAAPKGEELTPERVAAILAAEEVERAIEPG